MADSDAESDGPADVASFVSTSMVRFIYFCYITDRSQQTQNSTNIFDNLPALTPTQGKAVIDEMRLYLSTEVENVTDALQWWYEKHKTYPRLNCMVLDYLNIPGMLFLCYFTCNLLTHLHSNFPRGQVALFSCGHLVLLHTRSWLSVASTCALLCLGLWSHLGLVRDEDLEAVVNLNEVEGVMESNKLSAIFESKAGVAASSYYSVHLLLEFNIPSCLTTCHITPVLRSTL